MSISSLFWGVGVRSDGIINTMSDHRRRWLFNALPGRLRPGDHWAGLLFFPDSLAGAAAGGVALAGAAAGAAGAGLLEEAAEALSCLAAALYPSLR